MKESHSLLVTSTWFQLIHGGLLNLLLITPSTLSDHLPLDGSNFLLLSFSGYLIFPCFHLFSHLCKQLSVLNFLSVDTWIELCFPHLTQNGTLCKLNLQIPLKHLYRKQMMSLGTGYFDKITFSKMGQLNSKKLKVIFDNQILCKHKLQKVDTNPSVSPHSCFIFLRYMQFH